MTAPTPLLTAWPTGHWSALRGHTCSPRATARHGYQIRAGEDHVPWPAATRSRCAGWQSQSGAPPRAPQPWPTHVGVAVQPTGRAALRVRACGASSWPRSATGRTLGTPPTLGAARGLSLAAPQIRLVPVNLLVRQSSTVPSWDVMVRYRGECVQRLRFRGTAVRVTGSPNVYPFGIDQAARRIKSRLSRTPQRRIRAYSDSVGLSLPRVRTRWMSRTAATVELPRQRRSSILRASRPSVLPLRSCAPACRPVPDSSQD